MRTPFGLARSGKTWPGRSRSLGLASALAATRIVCARSSALMPVVTPSAASMVTVNAVSKPALLLAFWSGSSSWSMRSGLSVRQMSPRASIAMNVTCSVVTSSAATQTSPSFSRSSSSTMTTILPAR